MGNTPIQEAIRAYALHQVDGPYIMGATAKKCTPKYRNALAARYNEYADKIYAACPVLSGKQSSCSGCKWEGLPAHDCAQLSKFAAAAAGISLPSGSNSQWTKVNWAIAGEISALPMDVVCFVFHYNSSTGRMSHVGVYLGDGSVADARGHASGVLHKDVSSYPWTHYAIPFEVAREAGLELSERPAYAELGHDTIHKGAKGSAVAEAQRLLNIAGAHLKMDGIFGSDTQAAVEAFQSANGLTVDGVIGVNTWSKLRSLDVDADEDSLTKDSTETSHGPTDTDQTGGFIEAEPSTSSPEWPIAEVDALMADIDAALEKLRAAVRAVCTNKGC